MLSHRAVMHPRSLLFLLLLLLVAGCVEETPPPPTVPSPTPLPLLTIGLSSSAAPVATLVESAYEETAGVSVNFVHANNATLFDDLAKGNADAILVHYLPPDSDYWYNPVALDGLVLIVHPQNSVETLDRAQIQALYNSRIESWAAVGGRSEPVILVGRERGAGTRLLFNRRIMVEQRASINMLVKADNEALLAAVAAEPGAIGYSMLGSIYGREDVVPLAVDSIAPTPNSVGTQNYPLTVPLYFVAPAEPGGTLRAFLAWLQGDEGQLILSEKYGRVR